MRNLIAPTLPRLDRRGFFFGRFWSRLVAEADDGRAWRDAAAPQNEIASTMHSPRIKTTRKFKAALAMYCIPRLLRYRTRNTKKASRCALCNAGGVWLSRKYTT